MSFTGKGPRSRRRQGGHWRVRSRVERFTEPALLLLLRERPAHGYELLERIEELAGEPIDMGNLYRILRALEEEGLVRSEWQSDAPGPARRSYELTGAGRKLLDTWAESLRAMHRRIGGFLDRYERGKEVN
jgi:poly-beta-hydroxybutyrate-responsive repressor